MKEVIGVTFQEGGQVFYFFNGGYNLKKNVTVIVRTEQGLQFGKVVEPSILLPTCQLPKETHVMIRIASKQDYLKHQKNLKDARFALKECNQLVSQLKLPMKVMQASYTLDREQLIYRFVAEERVDFRLLARTLATKFHTRIELRQIGVRDKAKEIGGIGVCGQELCCKRFLKEFDSVSINMAKNQNLSLNPSKINGSCGRLLCCLKYEDACYRKCKEKLPILGKSIVTEKGTGKVVAVDILKGTYKVDIPQIGLVEFQK